MKIKVDLAALGESRWYEYAIRFGFGGAITVIAGVIAKRYGPGVGGLFLAFPAIFPAAATLIEKHEEEKEGSGGRGERASVAAGLDAIGSTLGAVGLAVFAIVVWKLLPDFKVWVVLLLATLSWALIAAAGWQLREILRKRARNKRSRHSGARFHNQAHAASLNNRRMR